MIKTILKLLILFTSLSNLVAEEAVAHVSELELIPRKTLDTTKLGVNAFANEPRFGGVAEQLNEVKNTIRLRHIRVLFQWNDQVQRRADSTPDFSFYDDIVESIPRGLKALAVLTGLPSWMSNSNNWIEGDPRKTFVDLWVKRVVRRYARKRRVVAFQIWNEPNRNSDEENQLLALNSDPVNYVELVALANNAIREISATKKIVSAATTAINQDYPETIEYNQALKDAGLESFVDVWGAHYYGTSYENVIRPGGVGDFLNSLGKPIWITEVGIKGINRQLAYMERTLPFLFEWVPGIKRAYIYQFTEDTPAESTYGLKNLTPGFSVSDLYIHLRDRAR